MKLKVGDSVLYLGDHNGHKQRHTGMVLSINKDKYPHTPYSVHWINGQDTREPEDKMQKFRKQYLEILGK